MANDDAVSTSSVSVGQLRSFIERYERLEAEGKEINEQKKEVMAEAKGSGFDVKVLKKIIALRKKDPADVSEEDAIFELYKSVLGL